MAQTMPRPKTDQELQRDVLAELNRDPRFHPAEIGVEVDGGVVTLAGTVSHHAKIEQAADVAARVAGVKDVANKLTATLADTWKRDDTAIASIVRDALIWDVRIPEERIDAIVRDGVVTLRGTVDSWHERSAAGEAVAHLVGVRRMLNDVLVAPPARRDEEIRGEIAGALQRRIPGHAVEVEVAGGEVTLFGTASSYPMRAEAEEIARGVRGVRSVSNRAIVRL